MSAIPVLIAGIILCIAGSAFFSASEMSFSSCNELRLENLSEDGDRKASRALYIVRHFDDALSAILIGNNLVNIASSSLCSVLIILLTGGSAYTWVGTAVITVLVIIFGETMPKIIAKKNANRLAMNNSGPVRLLMILFLPLIRLVVGAISLLTSRLKGESPEDGEAVEELQSIIDTAKDESVLDEGSSELVKAAIDFPEVPAYEAMTARVDMEAIDISDDWEKILSDIEASSHTRLPVYEESPDNIIGILHLNHFLKAMTQDRHVDIRSLLLEPCFVYKTMKLPAVLNELKRTSQHLAIVSDEYGGTLGVISMEDVLEQIVGDIWDETDDVEEDLVQRSDGRYEVDGDMPLSDLLELCGINEDDFEADSNTVGGWTLECFGTYPQPGATITRDGLELTVLAMDGRRVEKVLVRKLEEEDEPKEDEADSKPKHREASDNEN